jgi:prepilin-type N-terminal cleavage/methylation domain-containing protein
MERLMRATDGARKGFTIIELAIVIAIIGVISAISIPNLSIMLTRMRLNSATIRVERTIGIAKKMSIANRQRYCIEFTADAGHADNNITTYLIQADILQEDALSPGVWVTLTSPPELIGWTNNATTELYKAISLESDVTTTTAFGTTDGCTGLLFNNSGYLDNPTADFAFACGGTVCAKLTLRNKNQRFLEQRTLWVDPGGNVRPTVGPNNPPVLATSGP